MLAVGLALGSSLAWGFADFFAGLKSRRVHVMAVLLISQAAGLTAIAAVVIARGEGPPGWAFAPYAALASLAGTVGLGALYRGLAVGAMSVVAPIAATAAVVPVAFGLASGERPAPAELLGLSLALGGVALASREPTGEGSAAGARVAAGAGLALLAALGIGWFFVAMDAASHADFLWAVLVNRITGVTLLLGAALAVRPPLAIGAADARALAAIGLLDMTANTLFAAASSEGLLSLVSVLGSLYPLVTVLMAYAVLGERIAAAQRTGVVAALAGVVLISAG